MCSRRGVILGVLLTVAPATRAAEPPAVASLWQGASLTHLLTPSLAESVRLGTLAPHLEVMGGRRVLLLTTDGRLFDLGGRRYLPAEKPPRITSFARSDGILVVVRDGRLGWYRDGRIEERFVLPSTTMRIVAGPGQRLYLHGPLGSGSVVYVLSDGQVLRLLETPQGRISALAAIGRRIFFAIDNAIYTLAEGEQAGLVFVAAGERRIRSLAVDPVAGVLYFAAGDSVYAMRAGLALTVLRGLEGVLRHAGGALFVLDAAKRRLVKVRGLEALILGDERPRPPSGDDAFKE